MTAETPGQAAYESSLASMPPATRKVQVPYARLEREYRDRWEADAQAAIAWQAAQQPQPAPVRERRALLGIIDAVNQLDEPGPGADHIRELAESGLGEDGERQLAPERFAAEVRRAPCHVAGHDGEHFQWRAPDWLCGHVLAASLALAGIVPPSEIGAAATGRPAPELAAAMAETRQLRQRLTAVAEGLESRSCLNHPSKVSQICEDVAASIRRALDGR